MLLSVDIRAGQAQFYLWFHCLLKQQVHYRAQLNLFPKSRASSHFTAWLSGTTPCSQIDWVYSHAHLFAVIGPGAKLHDAGLLVKREVLDVYLTRGLVDGRGFPLHLAIREEGRFGSQRHLEVTVGAAKKYARVYRQYTTQTWSSRLLAASCTKNKTVWSNKA